MHMHVRAHVLVRLYRPSSFIALYRVFLLYYYTHVYVHVDTHVDTNVDTRDDTRDDTHVDTHVDTYVDTHIDTHVDTFVDTHVDTHVDTRVDTHSYTHVHTHICRHVDTHVYTHVCTHAYMHVFMSRTILKRGCLVYLLVLCMCMIMHIFIHISVLGASVSLAARLHALRLHALFNTHVQAHTYGLSCRTAKAMAHVFMAYIEYRVMTCIAMAYIVMYMRTPLLFYAGSHQPPRSPSPTGSPAATSRSAKQ